MRFAKNHDGRWKTEYRVRGKQSNSIIKSLLTPAPYSEHKVTIGDGNSEYTGGNAALHNRRLPGVVSIQ